jgi:acyl-CoA synthetase (AMP-forming)/AMP-acid ligase II/pimeloyl-ACP methyl ester carboxylesterase
MKSRSRTAGQKLPAQLPPTSLPGLDSAWSRLVSARDSAGTERTWHVLDTGGSDVRGTVLCVHGNPNWSYMWRGLASALTDWRVVAVDLLNMGFSERTGEQRRFADHVDDLGVLTEALGIAGPVVTVAHDWGGPISMGWAQRHVDQLAGIVLMNTGVARPDGVKVPPLISIARATLRATCEITPTFLHGALRMARPQLDREVYRGYTAPYRSADRRVGIHDFVEDIPVLETHPTHEPLAAVAEGMAELADVPALLLWGAKDIVFSDAFLQDLMARLPHAQVHRYADAAHQIIEDTASSADERSVIATIDAWLRRLDESGPQEGADQPQTGPRSRMWSAVHERRDDDAPAVIQMDAKAPANVAQTISFRDLDGRIEATAAALVAAGITPGTRLATLVPPGIDLMVLIYACLRAGIVVVALDAALGLDGMRRALRSSRPDVVVGDWRGLSLAKSLRLPARRVSVAPLAPSLARGLGAPDSLAEMVAAAPDAPAPDEPAADALAAIVFTSGSTGPSKGVRYTHRQLEAQRDAVIQVFDVQASDRLVVAFAPFAVLAPAVGIGSVIPAMDVTKPADLAAPALAEAAAALDATILFASPRVLANIAATVGEASPPQRETLAALRAVATAGAPVSPALLQATEPVFPNARMYTPYGMTEVLPVTVASAPEIRADASTGGVCVGQPLPSVDVAICAPDAPSGTMPTHLAPGEVGEIWVRAPHRCDGYDGLWAQQRHAFVDDWHRSGDVGHLDELGRLWIEGRVDHLLHTPDGVRTPVPIELAAEAVPGVELAAAVGVGPIGTQEVAVVVAGKALVKGVVADAQTAQAVRRAVDVPVAAVLVVAKIPVDRRHNSKIDRSRVQVWADAILRGKTRARI